MMRRLTKTGAMLAIAALTACESSDTETRTFRLEHISPNNAASLIGPYVADDATTMVASNDPAALSVAASPERLDQIEELLSRYDVPAPDVRLRFQLIEADGFTNVDPAIADVEAALRELFRFNGYRLVSEAMMTVSQYSNASQRLLGFTNVPLYLNMEVGRITSGERGFVELDVMLGESTGEILRTSVVVPGGQTVVLGNARPFEDRGALILVVRPEIQ